MLQKRLKDEEGGAQEEISEKKGEKGKAEMKITDMDDWVDDDGIGDEDDTDEEDREEKEAKKKKSKDILHVHTSTFIKFVQWKTLISTFFMARGSSQEEGQERFG